MRISDLIRAIIENDTTGTIKPVPSSGSRKEADANQTRQPRSKKKSRWQTPPALPKPPKLPAA